MTNQPRDLHGSLDALLERRLDEALVSYTPTEPRIGLEERIRARLAAEGQASQPRRRMTLRWLWPASAVLAAISVAVIVHDWRTSAGPRQQPNRASVGPSAEASRSRQETHPVPRPVAGSAKPRGTRHRGPELSAIDLAAVQEMRAPSHPAPEMPLTEEEKLLLRIVHKGDPMEIAMLNAEVREKQEAESEAEFHKWVEQSTKGERE